MSKRRLKLGPVQRLMAWLVALALLSSGTYGQVGGSMPPPTPALGLANVNGSPVGQALVPERAFAARLVEALNYGFLISNPN